MKIIRVFPRKTAMTPFDENVRYSYPGMFDEADEIHVSVAFTYDIPLAEKLASAWEQIAPVKIGGPAFNEPEGEFVPGMYIKEGVTITSRGCPNRCWFCSVWKRNGDLRELEIKDGHNIIDDNLLACSKSHIQSVFEMLKLQKQPAKFTGGLDVKFFKQWHIDLLKQIRFKRVFFAFDTDDDFDPLLDASQLLWNSGFTSQSHKFSCYCLVGYPKDTISKAESRLIAIKDIGLTPMAMLWKDKQGNAKEDWKRFQRTWARPTIVFSK